MTRASSSVSRRRFLKGLGAAGLSLPMLPSLMGQAFALDANPYKRVVFLVWRHGVASGLWRPDLSMPYATPGGLPSGTSLRDYDLTQTPALGLYMSGHLEPWLSKITMISGVSQLAGVNHTPAAALTASPTNAREEVSVAPDSVDTILGGSSKVYASPPRLDVLRLAGRSQSNTLSYQNNQIIRSLPQNAAFDQLFGDGFGAMQTPDSGPGPQEISDRKQKLVVDQSLERYKRLLKNPRLSGEDRLILQQTLDELYTLQSSLQGRIQAPTMNAPSHDSCEAFELGNMDQSEDIATDNINLITQAFACGHTRVAHWHMPSTHNEGNGAHFAYTQENRTEDGLYSTMMRRNCKWLAQLLAKMDGITEGNQKTMLDNSLVVVTSDMSSSIIDGHVGLDAPFLIAGGLGGEFRMGRYLDFHDWTPEGNLDGRAQYLSGKKTAKNMFLQGGPPHNELLISLMRGFGLGPEDWERDGLPGFGRYECGGSGYCDGTNPQSVQRAYVSYYDEIYAKRQGNAPGKELPYFRQGT